jgi:hypothetical protein
MTAQRRSPANVPGTVNMNQICVESSSGKAFAFALVAERGVSCAIGHEDGMELQLYFDTLGPSGGASRLQIMDSEGQRCCTVSLDGSRLAIKVECANSHYFVQCSVDLSDGKIEYRRDRMCVTSTM